MAKGVSSCCKTPGIWVVWPWCPAIGAAVAAIVPTVGCTAAGVHGRVIRILALGDTAKPMLSLCAAVAVLVLGVSFDTAWRLDAGISGIKLVLVPVVLCCYWCAPTVPCCCTTGQRARGTQAASIKEIFPELAWPACPWHSSLTKLL